MFINLNQFLVLTGKSAKNFGENMAAYGFNFATSYWQAITNGNRPITSLHKAIQTKIEEYNKKPESFEWKTSILSTHNLQVIYRIVIEQPVGNKKCMQIFLELMERITSIDSNKENDIDKNIISNPEYQTDAALEKYLKNIQAEPDTPYETPSSLEGKPNLPRDVARAWFEAKKGTGRYKGYFETSQGKPIHNLRNKLTTDEIREYSLFEIMFPDGSRSKDSVNLCGRGGSGKTYQIFHCIYDIFEGITTDDDHNKIDISEIVENVVPIYVPLNSVEKDDENCIVSFLSKNVWGRGTSPEIVTDILNKYAENILIFADGLNEVTDPETRRKIVRDICTLRQLYRTRFLVSSRVPHNEIFNSMNFGSDQFFTKARVLELSQKQIDNYFFDVGCVARYRDVPVSTRKLLETPQGCVMFADYVRRDKNLVNQIESLGQLISDYSQSLLNINNKHQRILVEKVLKKIAHYMLLHDTFKIRLTEIEQILSESEMNSLFNVSYNIESVFSSNDDEKNKDVFEFSHQNFRDNYCAQAFSDKLKSISADNFVEILNDKKTFVNNNITTNDEILELVSNFTESGCIQNIINILRMKKNDIVDHYKDNYDFPLRVLIRIYAFSQRNCLAGLNLSKLDLTEISLNGYELFDREGHGCVNLDGSKINANTFLKAGLQTASSTICKYELNGKTYIAAFAAATVMIIDIEENQIEIIRDMPNFGWVTTAVPKQYNGQLCIFLGCRNGSVVLFHPEKERNFRKEIFIATKDINTAVKGQGEIETILFPEWNGCEYIVFCNSNGEVFCRELHPVTSTEYHKLSLYDTQEEYDSIKKKFDERDWNITCNMTNRKNSVLVAFGNKVFSLKLDSETNRLSKNEIRISRKREEPYLILDIQATPNYIFINEGDLISIIANSRILQLINREICVFEAANTLPKNISRHYSKSKEPAFYFRFFSEVPAEMYAKPNPIEAVLIGLEAYNVTSYETLPKFFEIGMKYNGKDISSLEVVEIRNEQNLATHTGVYYYLSSTGNMVHLATTCDDRSVSLTTPHNEEIPPTHINGAYNGVHDIRIIDSENVVCALYDGNVIHIAKNFITDSFGDDSDYDDFYDDFDDCRNTDGIWAVKNVMKIHGGWVWKILLKNSADWDDEHNNVLTCSYDKTLMLTDLKSKKASQEIIHGKEAILDFYISSVDESIWAISQSAVYHSRFVNGKWECDAPVHAAEGVYIRSVTENTGADRQNNIPLIFYNSGNGSDGCLAKVSDGKITDFVNMGKSVFIRKMINYSVNGENYLIAAGERDKKSYLAIYKVISHNEYELISSLTIPDTTGANAFALTDFFDIKYIFVLCKNNRILLIRLNDNMTIDTVIAEALVSDQPMCIAVKDDLILAGLLNGQIMQLSIDDTGKITVSEFVKTHADLISNPDVILSTCEFESDDEKESFIRQLKDYFTI